MAIKFQCIDESHAIVAALRMKGLGRKTVRLGRAVVCEGDWCQQVTTVAVQNMAHTLTPTKYDLNELVERGEL